MFVFFNVPGVSVDWGYPLSCPDVGVSSPRGASFEIDEGYSSRLPNPRLISRVFHTKSNVSDTQRTNMFMQFAQFIDHDITAMPKNGE